MHFLSCRCVDAKLMKKFSLAHRENEKILQEVSDIDDGSNNETNFQWALRVRNIDVLKQLLNEGNSNHFVTNDEHNRSPFHIACKEGNIEFVKMILDNLGKIAIDINGTDNEQLTGILINNSHLNIRLYI